VNWAFAISGSFVGGGTMTLATVRALERRAQAGGGAAPVTTPHPFAEFLRTIGRGATLGRPLDETEAEQAMGMILDGAVEPVQLGAFLLVLRYRTETPAELAGFVRAARARSVPAGGIAVDLDWPSYADRHKQLRTSCSRRCCSPRAACAS
jgi:hypothetical protein